MPPRPGPLIEPISGTWPSGNTKSLVFTVAPSSFAAFFKSCSVLARSESSWVFCDSRVLERSFLNSVFHAARISSNVGVAGGFTASNWNTAKPCDVAAISGGDFSAAVNTASMNCGAGPNPGTTSLRPKKSEVTTGHALRGRRGIQPLRSSPAAANLPPASAPSPAPSAASGSARSRLSLHRASSCARPACHPRE